MSGSSKEKLSVLKEKIVAAVSVDPLLNDFSIKQWIAKMLIRELWPNGKGLGRGEVVWVEVVGGVQDALHVSVVLWRGSGLREWFKDPLGIRFYSEGIVEKKTNRTVVYASRLAPERKLPDRRAVKTEVLGEFDVVKAEWKEKRRNPK